MIEVFDVREKADRGENNEGCSEFGCNVDESLFVPGSDLILADGE